MVATWPGSLPVRFEQDGYREGLVDTRIVAPTDVGPAKVRPRASNGPRPMSGSMVLTHEQKATLETFIQDTLLTGSLPFEFPAQVGEATLLVRFDPEQPLPEFVTAGPTRWLAVLALEVLP